ncbi:Ankyrin repeat family protein, partial [Prunus dulcis]
LSIPAMKMLILLRHLSNTIAEALHFCLEGGISRRFPSGSTLRGVWCWVSRLSSVGIAEWGEEEATGPEGEGASWLIEKEGIQVSNSHRRRQTVDAQNGPANIESNLVIRCARSSAGKRAEALGEMGWEVKVGALHKVPMWDFVQAVVVATRVLEIRFGS